MEISVIEITKKFAEVQQMMKHKMLESLSGKYGTFLLADDDVKRMKAFTNMPITEVGLDSNVSGRVYVKANDVVYAFDALNVQTQYNIVTIFDEILDNIHWVLSEKFV
jgi:hypothetical protein